MEKRANKKLIMLILIASIALVSFVSMMILVLTKHNFVIDKLNEIVFVNRNEFWNKFFKIFTYFGSFYVLLGLTAVVVSIEFIFIKNKKTALFYSVCFGAVCVLNVVFKFLIRRIRPEHFMMIEEVGFSFPSGHAMMSLAFFILLSHFIYKQLKNKPLKAILISMLAIITIVVGFSRIYLGVHYFSDVLAGWCLTISILTLAFMANNLKTLRSKNKE